MTEPECETIDRATLRKYYKIREPAWEDYKLRKISQKEYDTIQGKAWKEYEAAIALALKEYEAAVKKTEKKAWEKYEIVRDRFQRERDRTLSAAWEEVLNK